MYFLTWVAFTEVLRRDTKTPKQVTEPVFLRVGTVSRTVFIAESSVCKSQLNIIMCIYLLLVYTFPCEQLYVI